MDRHDKHAPHLSLRASVFAAALILLLARPARSEEEITFHYPAGRRAFVRGERIRAWLRLPPCGAGTGELTLSTETGVVVKAAEEVRASRSPATIAYSIDSALLGPGRYLLRFRLGKSGCESAFRVTESVPATHFPIAIADAALQNASETARCRDLKFNMAVVRDIARAEPGPVVRAGMLWMRRLVVKAGSSPADPGFMFAVGDQRLPLDRAGNAPGVKICRLGGDPPLDVLGPLLRAALARKGDPEAAVWVSPHVAWGAAADLRRMVLFSLASGAAGVVYPSQSAQPGADFHATVEAASLNDLITRYGDFLLALKRKRSRVAVLDSRTTHLHDLGRNPLEQGAGSRYPTKVAAAWAACARVGLHPEIIEEEAELRHYSLILAPGLRRLPGPVIQRLQQFIKAGGTVIVDKDCGVPIEGSLRLPFAFPAPPQTAAQLRRHLQSAGRSDIAPSGRHFLITEFTAEGPGRFFWVVNFSESRAHASAQVLVPRGASVVYDVLAGEEVGVVLAAGADERPLVRLGVAPGEAKLLAILPRKIGAVELADPFVKENKLSVAANIVDDRGGVVAGPVPAAVVVLDEAGAERFRLYRYFESGKLALEFPLGINERPGRWFVRVTELFSRRSQGAAFSVPELEPINPITCIGPADVFDRDRCTKLLKRARTLALIAEKGAGRKAAEDLAAGLQRFAIKCEIHPADALQDNKTAPAGDTILIGSPTGEAFAARLRREGLLPVALDERGPGRNRALVFWAHSAFKPGTETIAVLAEDRQGLARGAQALLDMCSGRDPESPRPAKLLALRCAPVATRPPPPASPPVLSFGLSDAITGVAAPASGRFILAASLSGEICAVTARGEEAWRTHPGAPARRLLLPARSSDPLVCFDTAAEGMSIVSTSQWRFEVPGEAPSARITTACLSEDGSRVFVGTSAGHIFRLQGNGEVKWRAALEGTPAAVAQAAGRVAAADARAVMLFTESGAQLWKKSFPGCACLAFSPDGRTLVAGSRSGLVRALLLAGGGVVREYRLKGAVKGILRATDGGTLAVCESGVVARVGPGEGRSVFDLGHNVQVVAEPADGRYFAAASLGGTVSIFDSAEVLRCLTVPDERVSSMAIASGARRLLVGGWSGTVRVFRID